MTSKTIVFALGIFMAACSGSRLPEQLTASAAAHRCAGGLVWSDRDLARYAGCSSVAGDLSVTGVETLAPLASLHRVEGTLRIRATTRLYGTTGLERLESVGALELLDNRGLINLAGLNRLTHAERVLVSGNPRLSSSSGFLPGLARAETTISIQRNAGLRAEGIVGVHTQIASGLLAER